MSSWLIPFFAGIVLVMAAGQPAAAQRFLLVTGFESGNVVRFDLRTGSSDVVVSMTPGVDPNTADLPRGVAIDDDRNIYVALRGTTQNIRRFSWDGQDLGSFTQSIGGYGPGQIGFDAAGDLIVAGDVSGDDSIYRYDGGTGELIDTFRIAGCDNNVGLLVSGDSAFAVSYFTGLVAKYELSAAPVTGEIVVDGGEIASRSVGLATGHNGNLFLAAGGASAILEFDSTDGHFVGRFIELDEAPRDVVYEPELGFYFVTTGSNSTSAVVFDQAGSMVREFTDPSIVGAYSIALVEIPPSSSLEPWPPEEAALEVAPNPISTVGRFQIRGALPSTDIVLFDCSGREVGRIDPAAASHWVATLAPGIYFARQTGATGYGTRLSIVR
ncbi:MAG: hypothetical protein KDA27_23100 [Candidatus Eisenbacteria bacterium]|uniref:Uncharacterized protein n=1 Tax=Eiseniibacteriota bacterium TaxID=2212470 RepID=A0A956NKD8_UNCEI|nr:hypothetical protein [Candidatus Eisenbacteria bacterium]